ncbi:RagB/SusD family nutrient uptake outer membrane protein [Rapidithrix thailandica]|uniref:RagB/SusD family nutrient uptake outer membrane protein n=1 Tax=Rapidithrix thailandica TaxID=413964 RepID=A0AAW9RZ86_9BACT
MKKNIIKIFLITLGIGVLTSCSDYLDVEPEDKFLESQLFSSEQGINSVLNGIYMDMTSELLYGGNLTISTVEFLAQRYNVMSTTHSWYDCGRYAYGEEKVKESFNEMWSGGYTTIVSVNKFIENLDRYGSILTESKRNILKGEAYGLRAFLHFDLLRLFGPVYSEGSTAKAIPYYTMAKAELEEVLTAEQVYAHLIQDLSLAEQLLVNDPVIESGTMNEQPVNDGFDFYRNRHLRLNYYAVKALEARIHLYAGNKEKALAAANGVIEQASQWFPWTEPEAIISAGGNPDRVFSNEVIFGVQNMELYTTHKKYFSSELRDSEILAPNLPRIEAAFENNENDYRYNSCWKIPVTGGKNFRTFFKYEDILDKEIPFRFLQPLIKMSEMYYIVAECEQNIDYLNTVRYHRGLTDLESTANLESELQKEYTKEFFGEGQLFFYYKRKNVSRILNGSSTSGYSYYNMSADTYVLPMPESETRYR